MARVGGAGPPKDQAVPRQGLRCVAEPVFGVSIARPAPEACVLRFRAARGVIIQFRRSSTSAENSALRPRSFANCRICMS